MARSSKFGPHRKRGAVELRRYLDGRGESVPRFCETHGLDRIQVQRMLLGQRERVSVDFALAIEKATDGVVTVASWGEPATIDDDPAIALPTGS